MNSNELRDDLAKLHAELSKAGSLDAETRRLLAEINSDIARLVEPAAGGAGGAGAVAAQRSDAAAPSARLEGFAVQFEADHPALAANIRRFVDLLAKAGV